MDGIHQNDTLALDYQTESNPYRIMREIIEAQLLTLLRESSEYETRVTLLNHLNEEEKAKTIINE